jgi:site-specific recombinase XerD
VLLNAFAADAENRYSKGEIGRIYCTSLILGTLRVKEFHETGTLGWRLTRKPIHEVSIPLFSNALSEFASTLVENTHKSGSISDARKFLYSLERANHTSFNSVTLDDVRFFLVDCAKSMKTNSIRNVKRHLKMFCGFLKSSQLLEDDFGCYLSLPSLKEKPLLPAAEPEEVSNVLNSIDRTTAKGKRDYAMFQLGIVLGLRSIDIVTLKLKDIDWKRGEIQVYQSKTQNPVVLPLTKSVGEAIKAYILNGRPVSNCDKVFLRARAPFTALTTAGMPYTNYRTRINGFRPAYDGKSFHSLRRAVGKNMVVSGVPVTTLAQMLGQLDVNSTRQYISLDSHHLKECALDFSGIEVKGGVFCG